MTYSFIVAIYKVEKYIGRCIESLLNQTYDDFEVILVDDGSPDNCPSICDNYAKKDNRIRVIHKENGGLISAREAGLNASIGEYICFVDGDDFIKSDMLETYNQIINHNDVDIICSGYSSYFSDEKIVEFVQKIPIGFYSKDKLEQQVYSQMLSTSPFFSFYIFPSLVAKCFKKSILNGVYDDVPKSITLGEDVAVSYQMLYKANGVFVTAYCGYMYRQNPESMTHKFDKNLYIKIKVLIEYMKCLEQKANWNSGCQIDEYAVFLLNLARVNELIYNNADRYKDKRKNFLIYLNDSLFFEALKKIRRKGLKNSLINFFLRKKWIYPLYLYGIISRRLKG